MIIRKTRLFGGITGLTLLLTSFSAQAAILDVNTLSVDYVEANITINSISSGANSSIVPPAEIVMGTYQDPILSFNQTFTGGSFEGTIYSTDTFGEAVPSGSVNTLTGTFDSIDLSSLRLSGIFMDDNSSFTYTFDTELWPVTTSPTSTSYDPLNGDFSLSWAFADSIMFGVDSGFISVSQQLDASFDLTISGNATVVPLPASFWLLASGLVAFANLRRRKRDA